MPQKNNLFLIRSNIIIIIQDLDLQSGNEPFKYYVSMFLAFVIQGSVVRSPVPAT